MPTVLPTSTALRIRAAGYLIMGFTVITPLVELIIRSAPARIHSPAWRLGLIGAAAGQIPAALVALFVIFVIAAAAEDRGVSYAVSSLSIIAAAMCLLATGVFALDALQMRGLAQSSLADNYDAGSIWVTVRLAVLVLSFVVLAVSAFRVAGSSRRVASPQAPKKSGVLVGATRPATAPSRGADVAN
jgi:hypothetical protein